MPVLLDSFADHSVLAPDVLNSMPDLYRAAALLFPPVPRRDPAASAAVRAGTGLSVFKA
jgi:hypothetical protein